MFQANVIGNIHLFNLTLPLVQRGRVKKVIAISSGFGDVDLTSSFDIYDSGPYSISKAALNMAVAKYSAEFSKDGLLFLSISPGMVDTGHFNDLTDEQKQVTAVLIGKFQKYSPSFAGPITTKESVELMMSVINKASVEGGNGGTFISQLGTKQWL